MSNLGNKEIMAQNIRRYCDQKGMSMMKLSEELDVPFCRNCKWWPFFRVFGPFLGPCY